MGKIVAIGGGQIGRDGTTPDTTKLDKESIKLTGKKNPKLLFIPTASSDSELYYDLAQKHFGKRLGCRTDVLYLVKNPPSQKDIAKKISSADIIYVGGGNTLKMLRLWKKYGVDKMLKKAWQQGTVMTGLSAGSICWFRGGTSDSRRDRNPKADLIKIKCLDFIPAMHSPHYDVEKDRRPGLKKLMRKTPGIAIAIDDCCAVEFVNKTYRVIAAKKTANAYKVYWLKGKYHEDIIPKTSTFQPLKPLLSK